MGNTWRKHKYIAFKLNEIKHKEYQNGVKYRSQVKTCLERLYES